MKLGPYMSRLYPASISASICASICLYLSLSVSICLYIASICGFLAGNVSVQLDMRHAVSLAASRRDRLSEASLSLHADRPLSVVDV